MGKSKASPDRVLAAERRVKALELRKLGFTYRQIGEQLGFTEAAAHKAVTKALRELNDNAAETAAEVRRLELERLDDWLLKMAKEMRGGNVFGAVDRSMRIMARRAKLLGLDAPTKLELAEAHDYLMAELVSAAQADSPHGVEAVQSVARGETTILGAYLDFVKATQQGVRCLPQDIDKMTTEEIARAAQGNMRLEELARIRKRPDEYSAKADEQ